MVPVTARLRTANVLCSRVSDPSDEGMVPVSCNPDSSNCEFTLPKLPNPGGMLPTNGVFEM